MSEIQTALREALAEVLEKMFFVGLPEEAGEPSADAGPEIEARLEFAGEPGGRLELRLPAEAARLIAADFLGTEANEIGERQALEVVGELANMICGAMLSRLESEATFHLQPAEVTACQKADWHSRAEGGTWAVQAAAVGTGTLTVRVTTERPACLLPEKRAS